MFTEKDAVAGVLSAVTEEYGIALHVIRGYVSIGFAGHVGKQWKRIKKPIFAYYVGDHDPSGRDIERSLRDKLEIFSGKYPSWERLAVDPEDIRNFNLIALPVKRTDKRAAAFRESFGPDCCEVDALPPDELRRRVRDAILSHIDPDAWERLQQIEAVEQQTLADMVDKWRVEG